MTILHQNTEPEPLDDAARKMATPPNVEAFMRAVAEAAHQHGIGAVSLAVFGPDAQVRIVSTGTDGGARAMAQAVTVQLARTVELLFGDRQGRG